MSKRIFVTLFALFVVFHCSAGDEGQPESKSKFSIYLDSPLFFKYWHKLNTPIVTANLEYRLKYTNRGSTLLSLGYGRMFSPEKGNPGYSVLNAEIKKTFGKKTHFLETGLGIDFFTLYLMFRIGYRAELFDRLLLRVHYTPYILIDETRPFKSGSTAFYNSLSISAGYMFGGKGEKGDWDKNWKWLSSIQFNTQPVFIHFAGYDGFYFTVGPEFELLAAGDRLSVKPWIAYAYGPASYSLDGLSTGIRAVYGKGKHFVEAGAGLVWFPQNGYYSGNYFTVSPELGYRIHLWKRFMARATYTPYWWMADKSGKEDIENNFVNSVTIGVGLRLH